MPHPNNAYSNLSYTNQDAYQPYSAENSSPQSPKKFMNSLNEMHGSVTSRDRELKRMKELEYQAQLQAQIEEKKRFKAMEKFKTDLELEKEMKRYAAMAKMEPSPETIKTGQRTQHKIFERR